MVIVFCLVRSIFDVLWRFDLGANFAGSRVIVFCLVRSIFDVLWRFDLGANFAGSRVIVFCLVRSIFDVLWRFDLGANFAGKKGEKERKQNNTSTIRDSVFQPLNLSSQIIFSRWDLAKLE
jgi:hypothetical protein